MAKVKVETTRKFILALNETEADLLRAHLQNPASNEPVEQPLLIPTDVQTVLQDIFSVLNDALKRPYTDSGEF